MYQKRHVQVIPHLYHSKKKVFLRSKRRQEAHGLICADYLKLNPIAMRC